MAGGSCARVERVVAEAMAAERRLRALVRIEPLARPPRLVAGADVAYGKGDRADRAYAAAAVVALPDLEVVERAEAEAPVSFPYVPGLFALRELPALLAALARLRLPFDAILFDAHGIAHPRRFGLACHAGALLGRPAIGCAKTLLAGAHGPLGPERGASAAIAIDGEVVGAAVRTRARVRPVYVSPGHLADVASAADLVLRASRTRIPEPLRAAGEAANAFRARCAGGRSPAKQLVIGQSRGVAARAED